MRRLLRRLAKILAWIAGLAIAIPALPVVAVLIVANTPPGQRWLAALVTDASGGMVRISGLSGRFPDRLAIAHLAVADAHGPWITLTDTKLDWSPAALLHRTFAVSDLAATEVQVLRLPQSTPSTPATPSKPSANLLPVTVSLARLHIGRLVLDQPVAGAAATLSAQGSAQVQRLDLADLPNHTDGQVQLDLQRLDAPGTYRLTADLSPARIAATLNAREPAGGLLSQLGKLPNLGAIAADLTLGGPQNAVALNLTLSAGQLHASAQGPIDLVHQAADLRVAATAPAMAPRPDLSWRSVAIDAQLHGQFEKPDAQATVRINGLAAGGATVAAASFDVSGNQGAVSLTGALDGLRIPGPHPDLLAGAPLRIAANLRLDVPGRPARIRLDHPLLEADTEATLDPDIHATLHANLPDLAPFGALGGIALAGHAAVTATAAQQGDTTTVVAQGTVGVTGGMAPLPGLIGNDASIAATARLSGQDFLLDQLSVAGRTLSAEASGSDRNGTLSLAYRAALSDLSVIQPSLSGDLAVQGHAEGPETGLALAADITGHVAARGFSSGELQAHVAAQGLPGVPTVSITGGGQLAGAPLAIDAAAQRAADGTLSLRITKLDWQSLHADGAMDLPAGATLPQGKLQLGMADLGQLRPFVGLPVSGSLQASLDLPPAGAPAAIALQARDIGTPGNTVRSLDLKGTLAEPLGARIADLTLTADGIAAAGATGRVTLTAKGPQDAVATRLDADLRDPSGTPARVAAAATLNATGRGILLSSLTADWHGLNASLLAPAQIDLARGAAVNRLRLALNDATIDLAGRLSPTLDATLAVRNVTPALLKPFAPDLSAEGLLQADARLTGSSAAPSGNIRLTADRLRLLTASGRFLPPASLTAQADLAGGDARLTVRASAGNSTFTVTGTAPLQLSRPLALHVGGSINLDLLEPILLAQGRSVRGTVALDASLAGTAQTPVLGGSLRLANGEVHDFTQGIHITSLSALIDLQGDTLRLTSVTGHAGAGTIGASGTVGVLAPGLPTNLALNAHNARLLASDLMTATIDAGLTIQGQLDTGMAIAGTVHIDSADIRVPDKLPPSIARLDVIRPGEKPPPPPSPGPPITLAITVQAPNPIFIRGRGLYAVLEGNMKVSGTVAKPVPQGQLTMQRGTFSVVGTTLTFTRGQVQFAGSLNDPLIDFVAQSQTATVLATLEVTGTASNPQIKLSSNPPLPQDEVLSQLLFGQSTSQLSPFQLAEIAQALAQFGGLDVTSPLSQLRNVLGLDRLTVGGGGATGTTPTLEAGKYVARGVYVGARQGLGGGTTTNSSGQTTTGTQTQATVQIDLTKHLKAQANVGSGPGANAVGLTYQFDY